MTLVCHSALVSTRRAAKAAAFRFCAIFQVTFPRVFTTALALIAAVFFLHPDAAMSESRRLPTSNDEVTLSFAPVVKRVSPAVVNIYTKTVVKERPISPFFNDPFFKRFFGDQFNGVPQERILQSLGSGVIVRSDGYIVTNHHVIRQATEITVVLTDRREFPAK